LVQTSVVFGKKKILGELCLGALQNAALVAFEAPEIIGPQILREEAAGLLLALNRVGR